jgi:NAD(P)H-dependent FMN reductase
MRKKILAISGSTKYNSTSHAVLKNVARDFTDLEIKVYNSIASLPHFYPDADSAIPMEVADFRQKIQEADGVLFCTPEYVFSLPGSLKNAIEWTVATTLFSSKPVAIIVAAASGEKALESLDLIMTTLETVLPEDSKLLIKGARGKIMADKIVDQEVWVKIRKVINSLVSTINDSDKTPFKYRLL